MTIYNIHHTKASLPTIDIDESAIDASTDLKFFGRRRLQYGQDMNQNILFLLEHFACPENSISPGNPDLSSATNVTNTTDGDPDQILPLRNPVDGQLWYNSTQKCLFFWDELNNVWSPIGMEDDIAANWGILYNGTQLPKPISSTTGHIFDYSECSWIVSPFQFPQQLSYMLCETDATANLTTIYKINGDNTIYSGFATYLIVGIRGNVNHGSLVPVPSQTPTISLTPTGAVAASPTPTPLPPTPTPSAVFSGALTAYFNPVTPDYAGFFKAPVKPYFNSSYYRIKYPGISTTKYKILYTTTSPAAPHDPWTAVGGNYHVYIQNIPTTGSLGNFDALPPVYSNTIFCTGKSTEAGTQMVEGVDGNFYVITAVNTLSPTLVQLTLSTIPVSGFDLGLYGHPPLQNSTIDLLKFNYDYVYATGAYYQHYTGDPSYQAMFTFNAPSPYAQIHDLYILGGKPPYNIIDIRYYGAAGNGTLVTGNFSFLPSIIGSGLDNTTISPPVGFTKLATAPTSAPVLSAKSHLVGPVNLSNPNVTAIPNGYKVNNYLKTDVYYPVDYNAAYPGAGYLPEGLFHWQLTDGPGSFAIEGANAAPYTGNSTNFTADSMAVVVQDSLGNTLEVPIVCGWAYQVIEYDFINQSFGFSASIGGNPAGNVISTHGTYSYPITFNLSADNTSIRPVLSPAQMQYVFSLISPVSTTAPGGFQYTPVGGTPIVNRSSINGNSVTTAGTSALIHTGCLASDPVGPTKCTSFTGSRLTPVVSNQSITITRVINNITNLPVDISSNPITVTFAVTNSANTFVWNSLALNRTANNSGSFSSPYVPNNMKMDVAIPAGLNFSGTLFLDFFVSARDSGVYTFGGGSSGIYRVTVNFNNVT